MFLTYEIVHNVPTKRILHEYHHGSATVTDWRQFVREAMAIYLQDNSQKIGGPHKTVEIAESKFGCGNIIADIVFRFSGYPVEWNAVLVDRFSCPFKTEAMQL